MTDSTDTRLAELATAIKAAHQRIDASIRDSLLHARDAGRQLMAARDLVAHGEWMRWVKENCGCKHSTALLYINVARHWDQLANLNGIESLSLYEAAKLLGRLSKEYDEAREARRTEKAFGKETSVQRAFRLLCKSVGVFLDAGYKEEAYLDLLVLDRTLHRDEVEKVRELFFQARHRVNEAIVRLDARMKIKVDEVDTLSEERRQAQRRLDSKLAELDPTLLALRDQERNAEGDIVGAIVPPPGAKAPAA